MSRGTRFKGQLRWLHKVRLYPTRAQERRLVEMLRVTRELYNALLQQRRDAWTGRGVRIGFNAQYGQITDLRSVEPQFAVVYRECQDAVLRRLDLAFTAFFRRMKVRGAPGYPRFKPALRWNQLEFPHGDRALRLNDLQQRIVVPGVGSMRLRKGRVIPTTFGRVFLTTSMAAGMPRSSAIATWSRWWRRASGLGSTAASRFLRRPRTVS